MLVVSGYRKVDGEDFVYVVDPLGACGSGHPAVSDLPCTEDERTILSYGEYNKLNEYYAHWHDFYEFVEKDPCEIKGDALCSDRP